MASPPTDAHVQNELASELLPHQIPESTNIRHRCYLCSRTYDRQDHLSRHLKSHENDRSHRCPDCGKGFNRADLLNRHRTAHAKNAGETFRRRTGRACEACIKAKTKCDEDRPCKRCKTRDQLCEQIEGRRLSLSRPPESQPSPPAMNYGHDQRPLPAYEDRHAHQDGHQLVATASTTSVDGFQLAQMHQSAQPSGSFSASRHLEDADLLLGLNGSTIGLTGTSPFGSIPSVSAPNEITMDSVGFLDYSEQMSMPHTGNGMQSLVPMPFDVSNFTQDLSFESCDFDFGFLASGLVRPQTTQDYQPEPEVSGATFMAGTPQSDPQLPSEMFKMSPWAWHHWAPGRDSHTFSGQDEINVQEDHVNATDQWTSPGIIQPVHRQIDHAARDRMIRTVTQVAHERLTMPSFPSLELLKDLVDVFYLQESNAIDSYIHAATFECKATRIELILAMVAGGARYIALTPVWKMGLVIQEVVRLAIAELFERDNSTTRDLQATQASLLWLDFGVFSGFQRKTEIALSFLQPLVTMLSWSHAFERSRYFENWPVVGDTDSTLQSKWIAWAEKESRKRLVIHTFLHDSQVAMIYMKNPLVSATQMRVPLPASRELWLAPNAQAWAKTCHKLKVTLQTELPTVTEFFGNNRLLEQLGGIVDRQLCILAACHGIGHDIWVYRQQARLLSTWKNHGRRDRLLAFQTQQRDLYDDLCTFAAYCELESDASPKIILTVEFLMMSLHADLEDVQTFSGKAGEAEARRMIPILRAWAESGEGRTAVRHAGQVFRAARSFVRTKLRDFYALAFYHATLTLWVYGMVTSNAAVRRSGAPNNMQATPRMSSSHSHTPEVTQRARLDANDEKAVRAFTLLGQGTPGVQNRHSAFVPLYESKGLLSTAESILKSNFPQSRSGLPPLVENLANMMTELGKLSGEG